MELSNLVPDHAATMPLFDEKAYHSALAYAMDRIDGKYCHHTIYFGAIFGAQESAPARISFTQIPDMSEFG